MPANTNPDQISYLFDFTGESLLIFSNNFKWQLLNKIPLKIQISQNDISIPKKTQKPDEYNILNEYNKKNIINISNEVNSHEQNSYELCLANTNLLFLTSEKYLLNEILRFFLFKNKSLLPEIKNNEKIILLIPVFWEPLISLCLKNSIYKYFLNKNIDIITDPIPVFYLLMNKIEQDIYSLKNDNSYFFNICIKNRVYEYKVTKFENHLLVKFINWENKSSLNNKKNVKTININDLNENESYIVQGFFLINEYLKNLNFYRIDFSMDLAVGFVNKKNDNFFALQLPDSPLENTREWKLEIDDDIFDITIQLTASVNNSNSEFILEELSFNKKEINCKDNTFFLSYNQINYEKAFIKIFTKDKNNEKFLNFEVDLPRLLR